MWISDKRIGYSLHRLGGLFERHIFEARRRFEPHIWRISCSVRGRFHQLLPQVENTQKIEILRLSYRPPNAHYSNDQSFFDELHKQADVTFVDLVNKDPKLIERKIEKLMAKKEFDIIYKNFMKESFDSMQMKPLYTYGIPIFVSSGNCHSRLRSDKYRQLANYHKFKNIIVNNRSTIPLFEEYFDTKMNYIWVPWAYNPAIHRDYHLPKTWDVTIPAGYFDIPIRKKIHGYLSNSKYRYLDVFYTARRGSISPTEYAKYINQCKIAISTCQHDSYQILDGRFIGMTFTRYFEVPMCNTLHIAQRSADCEELGFKDGINVVLFDTFEEFKEKLDYYLSHPEEARRIVEESIRLAKDNHTYEKRVSKFLSDVTKNLLFRRF